MSSKPDTGGPAPGQTDAEGPPIEIGSVSRTVEVRSSRLESALNRGCDLLDSGDVSGAIDQFTAVIVKNPRCCPAYLNRGLACLRMKDVDAALRDTKAALKIDKSSADARSNLGLIYQEMGNLDRAMACFHAAIENDSDHAVSRLNRATLWYKTGKVDQARQEWINVLKLDPCGTAGKAAQTNLAKMMRDRKKDKDEQLAPPDKP